MGVQCLVQKFECMGRGKEEAHAISCKEPPGRVFEFGGDQACSPSKRIRLAKPDLCKQAVKSCSTPTRRLKPGFSDSRKTPGGGGVLATTPRYPGHVLDVRVGIKPTISWERSTGSSIGSRGTMRAGSKPRWPPSTLSKACSSGPSPSSSSSRGRSTREAGTCPVPRVLASEVRRQSLSPTAQLLQPTSPPPTQQSSKSKKNIFIVRKKEEEKEDLRESLLYLPGPGPGADTSPPDTASSLGSTSLTSCAVATTAIRSTYQGEGASRSQGASTILSSQGANFNGTLPARLEVLNCRNGLTPRVSLHSIKTTSAVVSDLAGQSREENAVTSEEGLRPSYPMGSRSSKPHNQDPEDQPQHLKRSKEKHLTL